MLVIGAVLLIVFAQVLSKRIGVAGPLILVTAGIGISLLPGVPALSVPPEWILIGVLPPLLYAAAVSAPAIEFHRDIVAIGGLAVVLVIVSSLLLGVFFAWAIPGLGFPYGVALGAILSPTDAVATSIAKKLGAPRRVISILEGEGLLNDATALVLLRTAIIAGASGFSFLATLGSFAWAVVSAVVVGSLAGAVALRLRAWTASPTANTALGLTVPFLAYIPTDAVGGSGLVAAVVAGIVSGQGALRFLTPEQRISDRLTWRTIEFVLEGGVFLLMGLQLFGILQREESLAGAPALGFGIAAAALLMILVGRAAYVFPVMRLYDRWARRATERRIERSTDEREVAIGRADLAYFDASPLTWQLNTVIVWAGMRGAVTLAAVQTLPRDVPQQALIVFIAFLVAAGSLLLQGLTLEPLMRRLKLVSSGGENLPRDEVRAIDKALRHAARTASADGTLLSARGRPFPEAVRAVPITRLASPSTLSGVEAVEALEYEFALIRVMRAELHRQGRSGRFSTRALRYVLDELDAYEISVRLHLESER